MKSTFKILFFIRKDKINAEGKSVIYVRLTINGSACQFSTKNEVSVKIWDAKNYRATGRSEEATNINSFLDGKHGQTDPVRTVQIDPFKTA